MGPVSGVRCRRMSKTDGVSRMWKRAVLVMMVCGVGSLGCGEDEVVYNPDSLYPENWESTYIKKKSCAKSATHGGQYVEVWVNPEGEASFDDRTVKVPAEAVYLKPQFEDSECKTRTWWTSMKPRTVAEDGKVTWYWQRSELDGTLSVNGDDGFCNGCHLGCPNGICSTP